NFPPAVLHDVRKSFTHSAYGFARLIPRSEQVWAILYNLQAMIRVCGPSRLHFGLLKAFSAETWPNVFGEHTVADRRFGGSWLMIAEPGIELSAEPAAEWS